MIIFVLIRIGIAHQIRHMATLIKDLEKRKSFDPASNAEPLSVECRYSRIMFFRMLVAVFQSITGYARDGIRRFYTVKDLSVILA
jgi:hypothetical protein